MLKQQFYTQSPLDRAAHWRKDPNWVENKLVDSATRMVPGWRNRSLVSGEETYEAVFIEPSDKLVGYEPPVFLGVDESETAWFSVDISKMPEEEAAALGVPVLVTRATSERREAIDAGVAELVGTDPDTVFEAARRLLADPAERARRAVPSDVFGDGCSGERIAGILASSRPVAPATSS